MDRLVAPFRPHTTSMACELPNIQLQFAVLPQQEHKDARSVHGNLVVGEEWSKDQRFQLV